MENGASCAIEDPLCPSLYDGGVCNCDLGADTSCLEEMTARALNAEAMLRNLVVAVRSGKATDQLLLAAQSVGWKHTQ